MTVIKLYISWNVWQLLSYGGNLMRPTDSQQLPTQKHKDYGEGLPRQEIQQGWFL